MSNSTLDDRIDAREALLAALRHSRQCLWESVVRLRGVHMLDGGDRVSSAFGWGIESHLDVCLTGVAHAMAAVECELRRLRGDEGGES